MIKIALLHCLTLLAQDPRAPVPDPAAQKEKEKLIREVFKDDYAKKSAPDRLALAKKLLEQGLATADDPAAEYVMLRESKDLATSAGDAATAAQAIAGLAKTFQVEAARMKLGVLTAIAQEAKQPESAKNAAEALLVLVDEADAGDDLETVEKAAALAVSTARRAKEVALAARAEARLRGVGDQKVQQARVKAARETLSTRPDDPGANLEVGQYECFVRGRWETGLPLLSKGSDDELRVLAARDLSNPDLAQDAAGLGDAWRERADKTPGSKKRMRERAVYWYEKALPLAAGLLKIKLEKLLNELGGSANAVARGREVSSEGLVGWWKFDEGSGSIAGDSSGKKNHGKLVGDARWVPGHLGQALQFREAGSRVTIPDAPLLRITGDLTIALWFRKDLSPSDWARLVGKGEYGTRNYGLWAGATFHQDQLMFQQWDDARHELFALNSHFHTVIGQWTHAAALVKGEEAYLYVGGVLDVSIHRKAGTPATAPDPVTIGFAGWDAQFSGAIDDVRIYNRALTEPEIQVLSRMK